MTMTVLGERDRLGVKPGRLYVDGAWCDASDGGTWEQVNPATNEVVTTFAVGSADDVDRAVRAARRAFDEGPWPRMHAKDRKAILQRLVSLIADHGDELNRLQTLENGMPVSFSSMAVVSSAMAAAIFDHHAGWIDKICGETFPTYEPSPTGADVQVMTFREPVGVVAAVIPWNAPMMLFAQKVAPALATGCTVVLKPSEYAALTSLRLTELVEEAGVPAGVFNLVPGPGDPTGEALITHPGVDKVTFTGSRAVGARILAASGDGIKRVTLELGGKSPSIVFDDAASVEGAAMVAMGMVSMGVSGQGCVCQTRSLVQRSVYDAFIEAAAGLTGMVAFGDPFDPSTTSGAIINQRQLERVLGFIERAPSEGARLVCGGDRPGGDLAQGNFVNPTLFADVDNTMSVARDEVFGPVLVAMPFEDEADAIRIANDTQYGLGAGVYTTNIARAFRVARAVRAGTVGVNEYTLMPNAPFGGYKTSGLGREGGWGSIEAFTETKSVIVGLDG
ncbi:MAG: aldehyde dehydrogenase family protein [Actinomycetota bacterium]|jgi:aldehyde dehydrogenase (NAD+)|nr:aldehyde dehydrogenase family protein [Actinomycetota bacterium]